MKIEKFSGTDPQLYKLVAPSGYESRNLETKQQLSF